MLKIKDNVDLKELEKYGFKKDKEEYEIGRIFNGYISIDEKDRLIKIIYAENMWLDLEDLLYDLTKEGLIEKVEELK